MLKQLYCLKKYFHPFYTAYDGAEGLELFKKHRPAIIITDIEMPKMNGLTMSQEILKIDPDVKIIITTAHDDFTLLPSVDPLGRV